MKNKALLLHHDYYDIIKLLSNEERGKLLLALYDYDLSGIEPDFDDRALTMAFKQIKLCLDSNREHYEKVCQKNAESAKKRWSDKEKMPSHAKAYNKKEKENKKESSKENENSNSNVNEKENESENENPKENVNVNEKENEEASSLQKKEAPEEAMNTQTLKKPHGEFKNVYLSDEEMRSLRQRLPDAERYIDSLSAYMKSSGKLYADHYAQLLNWRLFDPTPPVSPPINKKPPGERREPTFDVSEFTKRAVGIKYVPPKEDD